jgi:hypothetical protein
VLKTCEDALCYEYDYPDTNGDFRFVAAYLNGKEIIVSSHSASVNLLELKRICADLQIDSLLSQLNKYFSDVSERENLLEANRNTMEMTTWLQDFLLSLTKENCISGCDTLVDSGWFQNDERTNEFVVNVINVASIRPFKDRLLAELVFQVNENVSGSSFVRILERRIFLGLGDTVECPGFLYSLYCMGLIPLKPILHCIYSAVIRALECLRNSHTGISLSEQDIITYQHLLTEWILSGREISHSWLRVLIWFLPEMESEFPGIKVLIRFTEHDPDPSALYAKRLELWNLDNWGVLRRERESRQNSLCLAETLGNDDLSGFQSEYVKNVLDQSSRILACPYDNE